MTKIKLAFIYILLLAVAALAQSRPVEKPLEEFSVDQMLQSHVNAGTRIPDKTAFGGFATSGNYPKDVAPNSDFAANAITLVAQTDKETVFEGRYKGIRLLLINTKAAAQWFPAVDSRLYIIQEALDTDGNWKPIELLPRSWCGNSYHRVQLGTNEYWEFSTALYHGTFKTKLRFRLGSDERGAVYSNEFEGSVNPGQFTNMPKSPFIF